MKAQDRGRLFSRESTAKGGLIDHVRNHGARGKMKNFRREGNGNTRARSRGPVEQVDIDQVRSLDFGS